MKARSTEPQSRFRWIPGRIREQATDYSSNGTRKHFEVPTNWRATPEYQAALAKYLPAGVVLEDYETKDPEVAKQTDALIEKATIRAIVKKHLDNEYKSEVRRMAASFVFRGKLFSVVMAAIAMTASCWLLATGNALGALTPFSVGAAACYYLYCDGHIRAHDFLNKFLDPTNPRPH